MLLPLSRKIPLRDSTAWGQFASIAVIPRIYGRVILAPVPYDNSGSTFVIADHPVKGIVSITADNIAVTAYRLYHQPDSTGKTVAFLELQTAITIGSTAVAVTVEGLQHPVTGELMTNPADVAFDLLQWSVGAGLVSARFAVFASECKRAGVEINGALTDSSQTLRATLDSIMDSAGAAWSSSSPDFAMLLPVLVQPEALDCEDNAGITTEAGGIING